ncbi:MAG TPA: HAMP domain-containing sensor histidine kinase [Gammaproteobacteria bacterium]|jgi:two-component system sensor histidine kinase GlrK|nr:HAMP domain-containing sensor histidine kinase [Gammaproteobacteria bacterium]
MKIRRPRTLLGMVLVGLAVVTVPLLIAVGNALVKLGQLAAESETVLSDSATATLENQRVANLLSNMERNARQYVALQNVASASDLLTLYDGDQADFEARVTALRTLPKSPEIVAALERMATVSKDVHRMLHVRPDQSTEDVIVDRFRTLNGASRDVAQGMRTLIDARLNTLQESTRSAQQTIAWQSAALIPGMLILVVLFLLLVGRPMRQVDRAIRELGEGDFSRPIAVTGPHDIETLGRQLEWLRHRLKESADEKNKFLRHMSHELKTPLANIREGTELLLDGSVGPLDIQQQEVTGILRDNGVKLQKLIENLLTFSAWQTHTASLELGEFELKPMVFSVLSQHRLVISNKKIKLQLKVSAITVRADEGKLRLVLENLLSNAIKFTPAGGTIGVAAAMEGNDLVIDVNDSGPGVHPDDGDRIFEAFYQGRRPQDGPVGGTGIGLSVVAECAQAHGGSVQLVRDGHVGAHFQVRLPLRRAADKHLLAVANG